MAGMSDAFPSMRRPSIVEQIIDHFAQKLIRGELQPGQRLPAENELCLQFGVGRSALREAMKMLEALGVVTIQQGDGTRIVDKPSSALLSPLVFAIMLETSVTGELLELRSMIEVGYCQLAAQHATPADWERIEVAAATWEAAVRAEPRDVEALTTLDLQFHFALIDATHNPLISKIARTVEELFFASIRTALSQVGGLEWGVEGHRRILESIRGGDPQEIHQAVHHSLAYWGETLQRGKP